MVLIIPCLGLLCTTVRVRSVVIVGLSRINLLPRAPVTNIVCLCVHYLHLKDTSPAPSRPLRARPVELRRPINTLSVLTSL